MSGRSPASVLFTVSGVELAVADGQSISTSGLQGLVVAGTDGANIQFLRTDATGAVRTDPIGTTAQPITDGGGSLTIDAVSLPLPTGAATAALQTQPGVDIGDVTINNASGINAVNIQDGGNSITVDNVFLDTALSTRATEATALTLLTQAEFQARIGEVQASPTANTILGRLKALYDAIIARLGVLGQAVMASSTPVVIASDQSDLDVVLKDTAGVALSVTRGASIPAGTDALLVAGENDTGVAQMLDVRVDSFDARRRLQVEGKVTVVAPVPPPSTTAVTFTQTGVLSISTDQTDNFSAIPNGQTFHLQQIEAGCEGDSTEKGSAVEVYFFDGTTARLLERQYLNGFTINIPFADVSVTRDGTPMTGNGSTKYMRVVRRRLSGAAQEVDFVVRGYYA